MELYENVEFKRNLTGGNTRKVEIISPSRWYTEQLLYQAMIEAGLSHLRCVNQTALLLSLGNAHQSINHFAESQTLGNVTPSDK